ncbi:MAG: iron-containing alcohol dehydrogenase [Myxococcales bacterium]|nr:iron-containing alcohol dehydrogenase [Myxococcales bacterium]
MQFEFATASRVMFGAGVSAQVGAVAANLGSRALVVTGSDPRRVQGVLDSLTAARVDAVPWSVRGEPTVADVEAGVAHARARGCDVVVAAGGGSPLDAGKAIAALLTNEGPPLDYLEVIGKGRALVHPAAPIVAVPTTAGTGSEVTRNAVLAAEGVKVSLRSPGMLPRAAIVDPLLTLSLPPQVTADCGLDALTQCLEPLVCNRAGPLTDALAREGLMRAARSLRRAVRHGDDVAARTDMCVASLCGGLALANAALGAVHGFAGPIGGMFPAPHGAVCARLLPEVMTVNVAALRERAADSPALSRYREVARVLTGRDDATIEDGVAWVRDVVAELGVRPLAAYGVGAGDLPLLVTRAQRASSMRGNPIALGEQELHAILAAAC